MTTQTAPKHPAKFSPEVLEEVTQILWEYGPVTKVLDPFAGTGRIHWLKLPFVVGVELEPEWTAMEPGNVVANTLRLPFADATFDCMVTSPCYGNRFADNHNPKDGSRRRSYKFDLGRDLHSDNAGALQWGDAYRQFHDRAWTEVLRVLAPQSLIVLNVSNHIRKFTEQHVTEWHLQWFLDHGCHVEDLRRVETARLRDGANYEARVDHENVIALRFVAPELTPEDHDTEEQIDAASTSERCDVPPHRPGLDGPVDTGEGG
jgi:hypothetical protein